MVCMGINSFPLCVCFAFCVVFLVCACQPFVNTSHEKCVHATCARTRSLAILSSHENLTLVLPVLDRLDLPFLPPPPLRPLAPRAGSTRAASSLIRAAATQQRSSLALTFHLVHLPRISYIVSLTAYLLHLTSSSRPPLLLVSHPILRIPGPPIGPSFLPLL